MGGFSPVGLGLPGSGNKATEGIIEYLKKMFMQQAQGGAIGGAPGGAPGGGGFRDPRTFSSSDMPGPGEPPTLSPLSSAGGKPNAGQAYSLGGSGGNIIFGPPQPSTKTEPRAPLRFSWGSNPTEDYDPNAPQDILKMEGAPQGREGFMGAKPDDPQRAGGYMRTPGDTALEQYANNADPMAREGFRNLPMQTEIAKAAKDPAWREKETIATTERERGMAAQSTQAAQAKLIEAREDRLVQEIVDGRIEQARQAAGGQLDPIEEEALRQQFTREVNSAKAEQTLFPQMGFDKNPTNPGA